MSTPLRRFGLMAAFAEFSLLPELLASVPSAPGTDPPDSWRNILDSHGYNVDHMEDDERPPGTGLTEFMVGDAWALVNRLGLVDGDGLTQTGRALAGLDSTERSNAALYATLGEAVRMTYRGAGGVPLVDLLRHEARGVRAGEAYGGAGYCPGLLLSEVITLIEHACLPSPRPRRSLLDIRREIEELVIQPDAQRSRNAARCEFADALSAHHMQASTETEYREWVPMTLTEARATSMLLTAAGLLDLEFPIGPAQCLAPPKGLATPAATRDRIDAEDGVRIDVRGGAWQFNAPPQAVGAILAQLMRHDLGTNSKIFRDLGIDMAVRRARDNVPYLEDPGIREYRMINKALAMELLCSLWLASTDSPKRVVCHCETRYGLPHRFAPPLTHDAEAHYEAPFHVLAEVSAKRETARWHYRSQLEQALKHGRSLAEGLDTTQPVYGLVINGGRIDGDTRLQEVYREFVEENELGDDSQVRVIPMCTEHLALSLHEIHESLEPERARFSSEMFGELLEAFYTGLLDFEKSRKGEWMLETWREQVIERVRSRSQGGFEFDR